MTMKLWQWQNPTGRLDTCHFRLAFVRAEIFLIILNSYPDPIQRDEFVFKGVFVGCRWKGFAEWLVWANVIKLLIAEPKKNHLWKCTAVLLGILSLCSLCTSWQGVAVSASASNFVWQEQTRTSGGWRQGICWSQNAFDIWQEKWKCCDVTVSKWTL